MKTVSISKCTSHYKNIFFEAEIIFVISKLSEHTAQVWFVITSVISDQNCSTKSSIATSLHPFWNRPKTGLLVSSNIWLMQYWASFKLNSSIFWGERNKSFGNKSCKICNMILFVFHFPAIWLVTLKKPWNLIGCFVFSVASSLAVEKDTI